MFEKVELVFHITFLIKQQNYINYTVNIGLEKPSLLKIIGLLPNYRNNAFCLTQMFNLMSLD